MNKPKIKVTPFKNDDDDEIRMGMHGGTVWFETDYETMQEVKIEVILWAADQLNEVKK